MTIIEIQRKRIDLENAIAQQLTAFSTETGLPVEAVEVNRMDIPRHDGEKLVQEYGYGPAKLRVLLP